MPARDPRAADARPGSAGVPLVADIHFLPSAAMEAVEHVEKVRVNPGNYADKKRFAVREYTDADYAARAAAAARHVLPAGEALPGARARAADRHQPRVPQRPDHEPLRRHPARHGRERPGVPAHRRGQRLPPDHPLDEGLQSEGDDRGLPPPGRADAGGGHALPAAPGRHRGRRRRGRPDQGRDRHRLAPPRRPGRHDPRVPHRGQRLRDPGRPRARARRR